MIQLLLLTESKVVSPGDHLIFVEKRLLELDFAESVLNSAF